MTATDSSLEVALGAPLVFSSDLVHVVLTEVGEPRFSVLRGFRADICASGVPFRIGSVSGWFSSDLSERDLLSGGIPSELGDDLLSAAIALLAVEMTERSLLIIDRIVLSSILRGRRLAGAALADLVDLIGSRPLVLLRPEPLGRGGLGYEPGPFRECALERLCGAYRSYGLGPVNTVPGVMWAEGVQLRPGPARHIHPAEGDPYARA